VAGSGSEIAWLRQRGRVTCKFFVGAGRRKTFAQPARYTGLMTSTADNAEYAVVPEDFCLRIAQDFNDEQVSPLLCGRIDRLSSA